MKFIVSEDDAFQIETAQYYYYYALQERLQSGKNIYYKVDKSSGQVIVVQPHEIVDLIVNHAEQVLAKCSCIVIKDKQLQPLVR